ncbi:MAG: DUF2254 domain-containing protein [Coriobacteriia bacterium]|nr:DUF2254 domain-containing protein [Coriobacteriia bacterium]
MDVHVLQHLRERLRTSLWFVPAILVLASLVAAVLLFRLDQVLSLSPEWKRLLLAFGGGPESARAILETIAGSMLTLTGLVFSITILVLQLASSQYSPRTLRSFLRDRPSKLALGVFLGTFAFALAGLLAVRQEGPGREEFVPGLTVGAAFVMVLVSLGLFVYYIHHIAQRIRITSITASIEKETASLIEELYGEEAELRGPPAVPAGGAREVAAPRAGYVVNVDVERLVRAAARADAVIQLVARVGSFVPQGAPVLRVHGAVVDHEPELGDYVTLDDERTLEQDAAYGFRQLVDIAIRALSPSLNDPTSAVNAIDRLHALLRRLGEKRAPSGVLCDDAGEPRLIVPVRVFPEYLQLSVEEIARYGGDAPQVRERLGAMLADLERSVRAEYRPHVRQALRDVTASG